MSLTEEVKKLKQRNGQVCLLTFSRETPTLNYILISDHELTSVALISSWDKIIYIFSPLNRNLYSMQVENQLNALTQRNDWVSLSHEDNKTQAQGWNWGYLESKPQSPFSRRRRKRDLCVYIYIFIGCNLFDRLNIMRQPLLLQCLSWRCPLTAYVWFMMCYILTSFVLLYVLCLFIFLIMCE